MGYSSVYDFFSCFAKLTAKSSKAAKLFNSVQKAEVSWKRIKPLMKNPQPLEKLKTTQPVDVIIDNLSFAYEKKLVFSKVSLVAHPGEIIGVTGPVACGKSTFGKVLLGELQYDGFIFFGQKELRNLNPREIASTVCYLGHDAELISDTVKNNVLYGDDLDVMIYLSATALKDEVLSTKNGIDTEIGNNGIRLSGGQRQRLALARTFAHHRPIMILDDPFSTVDRKTEDVIFAKLQEYAKDKVVFLISHRLYHFPQTQKIIFMENGKTFVGTHNRLMADLYSYRRLYESQTGGEGYEK